MLESAPRIFLDPRVPICTKRETDAHDRLRRTGVGLLELLARWDTARRLQQSLEHIVQVGGRRRLPGVKRDVPKPPLFETEVNCVVVARKLRTAAPAAVTGERLHPR